MIGTAKQTTLRFAIGADLDAHTGADLAGGLAQCRVVQGKRRKNVKWEKRPKLVKIDICN